MHDTWACGLVHSKPPTCGCHRPKTCQPASLKLLEMRLIASVYALCAAGVHRCIQGTPSVWQHCRRQPPAETCEQIYCYVSTADKLPRQGCAPRFATWLLGTPDTHQRSGNCRFRLTIGFEERLWQAVRSRSVLLKGTCDVQQQLSTSPTHCYHVLASQL